MRRWRGLSAYATSGIPCRMWHIITTQYPPLLFERVAVSTAVSAYYLLPAACRISAAALRWCTATRAPLPLHHRSACVHKTERSPSTLPAIADWKRDRQILFPADPT